MIYDVWFIGDDFFRSIFPMLLALKQEALIHKTDLPCLYEYYNVYGNPMMMNSGVRHTIAQMINSVIKGLNSRERLPHFLVIIIDKDIIKDVNVFDYGAQKEISKKVTPSGT